MTRRRHACTTWLRACTLLGGAWGVGASSACVSTTSVRAPTSEITPLPPRASAPSSTSMEPASLDDAATTTPLSSPSSSSSSATSPWSAPAVPAHVEPQLLADVYVVEEDTYALPLQDGIASYYAKRFSGRKTSSGDRYDPKKITCAHKRVRLGHRLLVVDKDGRSVTCIVNDRGPYKPGRVVDLSLAAARQLDLPARGLARVHVDELLPAGHPRLRLPVVGAGARPGSACARRDR